MNKTEWIGYMTSIGIEDIAIDYMRIELTFECNNDADLSPFLVAMNPPGKYKFKITFEEAE